MRTRWPGANARAVGGGACCLAAGAVLLMACAVGHVTHDGDIYGIAFGHARLVGHCPTPVPTPAPTPGPIEYDACSRIEGGNLSTGAVEFLSNAVTGVIAYFSGVVP